MQYLMKSCAIDHRLDRADTIRIGTLNYFRENQTPGIGDDQEAALRTELVINKPRKYPVDIVNAIAPGLIKNASSANSPLPRKKPIKAHRIIKRPARLVPKSYQVRKIHNGRMRFSDLDVIYITEGSDALIFCMSIVDDKSEGPHIGYDAEWKMPRSSAKTFGEQILKVLNAKLQSNPAYFFDTGKYLKEHNAQDFCFELKHGPVRYRSLKMQYENPSIKNLTKVANTIMHCDMYKRNEYADQKEYRFCFRLMLKDTVVGMNPDLDHLDIDAADFRHYLL